IRSKTQFGNVVSSHSSACGASSFVQKLRIDSRSASCSSVKMKWRFLDPKSGLTTFSAVAMTGGDLLVRQAARRTVADWRTKVNSGTAYFPRPARVGPRALLAGEGGPRARRWDYADELGRGAGKRGTGGKPRSRHAATPRAARRTLSRTSSASARPRIGPAGGPMAIAFGGRAFAARDGATETRTS